MNDDWSFGLAAKRLIESGVFKPLDFTGMPLLSQVAWGAIFSFPGGFSFESLRVSTSVMAVLGIIVTYRLCREASGSRLLATLGASTLAFNPIYFALSSQFMTDVPFTAMATGAAYCLSLNLEKPAYRYYVLGLFLCISSTLNRQLGIVVPAGYAITQLLSYALTSKKSIHPALWLLPLMISLFSLLGLELWMRHLDIMPALYHKQNGDLLRSLTNPLTLKTFARNSLIGFSYIGLFAMPALASLAPFSGASLCFFGKEIERPRMATATYALSGLFLFGIVHLGQKMPLAGNILYSGGIGPILMVNGDPRPVGILNLLWSFLTVLSAAGGAIIAYYLFFRVGSLFHVARERGKTVDYSNPKALLSCFYFTSLTLYLAPLFIHGFVDRYQIPCLPLLLGWLFASTARRDTARGTRTITRATGGTPIFSAVLIALFTTYSTLGTRDLFALNRARWSLLDQLTKVELVSPRSIDGGFEFNGLYLYDYDYRPAGGTSRSASAGIARRCPLGPGIVG